MKDIAAALGSLVSWSSLLLSIITLWRTVDLERRLFVEPYFESKWKQKKVEFADHLSAVEWWLHLLETKDSSQEYFSRLNLRSSRRIELDRILRRYARPLAKALEKYLETVDRLSREIQCASGNDVVRGPTAHPTSGASALQQHKLAR